MPLIDSDTQNATRDNFHEVRHGKTYRRTSKKYGKKRARKQMIAIVLSNKRKAEAKKKAAKKKVARKR